MLGSGVVGASVDSGGCIVGNCGCKEVLESATIRFPKFHGTQGNGLSAEIIS